MTQGLELLTVEEMGRADRLTAEGGFPSISLMENAGRGIAEEIDARWTPRRTVVLCGPGNNGGDGFVAARLLSEWGWPVRVALLGGPEKLKGDAALAAERWTGEIEAFGTEAIGGAALAIDAVFGAGLARPVEGKPAEVLQAVADAGLDCVAVDVPSGVDGDTGAVEGVAAPARLTVTFFRKKPGHLLYPGRALCGEVALRDIGIRDAALAEIGPTRFENGPALWERLFPRPSATDHKYSRGHALVLGGARMTGAARLGALAARRIGAGLVTIVAPESAWPVYAGDAAGTLVSLLEDYGGLLEDPRRNAVLAGPGAGVGGDTRDAVLRARRAGKAMVIDADAVTSFADDPDSLFRTLDDRCVLTPHDGEFARLFGALPDGGAGSRADRAARAAAASGAVILFKGPDTCVAAPDGRLAINANAPPNLATAGTGDVLSGMILGLIARGMPGFEAACAAVWLHGAVAAAFGPGLIAEDLIDGLPAALSALARD
jgi:NAD(P)H-hydrate epimerase